MLNILIKETSEIKTLSVIDPHTDVDYIIDFIGNTGAFFREFERIEHDDATYQTTQSKFEWWKNVISKAQEVNDLMYANPDIHTDELLKQFENIQSNDLDDHIEGMLEIIKNAI